MFITKEYLYSHPDHIFVFGDNTTQKGHGGAAALRDCYNTYGFITKKYPNNNDQSFYQQTEYKEVFEVEMVKLIQIIETNPNKFFLISKLGAGLANKYNIYETIIQPGLEQLKKYPNVSILSV